VIPGRFHDGVTATGQAVRVFTIDSGWEIRDEAGTVLRVWRTDSLGPPEELPRGGVRLTCRDDPQALLVLPRLPEIVASAAARRRRQTVRVGVAACVLAALVVAGLVALLPLAGRMLAAMIPVAVENQLGDGIADNFGREFGTCRGAEGGRALTALVDRLGTSLPPEQRPRRVFVVDRRDVNAIALPGGVIILFRGLLAGASGPDEIAGVLAHEMTHVARRHPTAGLVRSLGVATLVALVIGDTSGVIASGLTLTLANAYSREDEAEADRGALDLLESAGIGGDGLAAFLRRLAATDAIPAWLSDHPETQARAAVIEAARLPSKRPALSTEQWTGLSAICKL
jgi:predicted Zn-dependent protease